MLEPVAIVGMACRVPGARGLAEFWRMLAAGEDAIRETPVERWDQEALFSEAALTPGKMNTRWGGFIDGVERFDPHFFGISPREAEHMDPQQRLLLEVVWEAIEDAGLSREAIAGSPSGVFIGMSSSDFAREELADLSGLGTHSTTGAAQSIAANRISYALDLNGPSMVVDTACSSSLVAIHLACHSLQLDEAGMAIAGGVNLLLSPGITVGFSQLNAMASDGRCKAFDARANGYVRSEGVGIVVLKRLKDALEAGDRIWAVIRGSAVNQDGRSNGLTAPSRSAQEAVLATAYRKAGVSPAMVQYVEAHGTGTKLGDPIEAGALGKVLGTGRATGDRCRLGSVKTNIGHLEGAAGVAGVIKVALAMHHRLLPPSLHFESPNPHIAFDRLPLQVQTALDAWPHPDRALLAGVSSFGFGGTNAHLVLEQAPEAASATSASERGAYLLPLSAHSREALGALARSFQPMLEAMAPPLPDLVYAASRRTHHDCRLALAFRTPEELRSLLSGLETADSPGDEPKFARPRVAFVLPGQGAQWYAMGRQLLESNVAFRQAIEAIDERFQPMAGWSLLEEWQKDEAHSRMQETEVAQPSLFALQVGLAAVWRSWGIRPDAVVGHSIGEVAAAYLAGVLDLDEALLVALSRSRLMQEATGKGKMAAVALSPEEAHVLLEGYEGRVALAAVNAPHSVTLSGDLDAMDELMATLQARQVFCRELKVRYAFHCHQLTPFQAKLKERLHEMSPKPPTCTLVSTLSGKPAVPGDYDADYWSRQMREPVAFYPAVHHLVERGFDLFVELSPHPVLSTSLDEILRADAKVAAVVPTLRRGEDESLAMMKALGELYVHGYPIDWTNVYPNGAHVSLPAYPWQHEPFPIHARRPSPYHLSGAHPLLGWRLRSSLEPATTFWEGEIDLRHLPYLRDHGFNGAVILPATAYVEMALAGASQIFGSGPHHLCDIAFKQPMLLSESEGKIVQLALTEREAHQLEFQICSRTSREEEALHWVVHASGIVRIVEPGTAVIPAAGPPLEEIKVRCQNSTSHAEHYLGMKQRGLEYGPSFQGVQQVWWQSGEALAQLSLAESVAAEASTYRIHPAHLDACIQASAGFGNEDGFLPVGIEGFCCYASPHGARWSHARLSPEQPAESDKLRLDVRLLDDVGRVVIDIVGLVAQRMEGVATAHGTGDWLYEITWQAQELPGARKPPDKPGSWLILGDASPLCRDLEASLIQQGDSCIHVESGETFQQLDRSRFLLNPEQPDQFRALLKEVSHDHLPLRGVVHLWFLRDLPTLPANLVETQSLGCVSVLHLVQALVLAGWRDVPRLWLVTRGVQAAAEPDARLNLSQAPLWGMARTVVHEHSELRCSVVDLPGQPEPGEGRLLFQELWADDAENQVAFRDDRRFVAKLERYQPVPNPNKVAFSGEHTYLITGGLGGLGLTVARWMAEKGAKHLLLVGRSAPGPSSLEVLESLWQKGVRVTTECLDVSNLRQVEDLFDRYRGLRGIVHAAGGVNDATLMQLDREKLLSVFGPKVQGAWNLHRLTQHGELDFLVFFSSAASLLGSPGQANYSAANAFLDSLAHDRRAQGLKALSINWGPWAEVGLAAAQANRAQRLSQQGLSPIEPAQGIAILERLMGEPAAQVGVLSINPRQYFQSNPKVADLPLLARLVQGETRHGRSSREKGLFAKAWLAADPELRRPLLENHLRENVAQILRRKAEAIQVSKPFQDLGFDSLMTLELRNRLENSLGLVLEVTALWKFPTLEALASHLADRLEPQGHEGQRTDSKESSRSADGESDLAIKNLVDALSEEDAETALLKELANILGDD